jgi:hypothetical protein
MPVSELFCDCPGGKQGELVGGLGAFLDTIGGDEQSWFTGHLEDVEGNVELTDLRVAVDLAAGAVLVDVAVGPVPAKLCAQRRQLADQRGQVAVERVAPRFQSQHRRRHAARELPVGEEVPSTGVEEDEPGKIGLVGLELRREQSASHEVRRDEVLLRVVDDSRDGQVVQNLLDGTSYRGRNFEFGRGRSDRGVGEIEQVLAFDFVQL